MQDKKQAIDHLKTHQKYPASREQLIAECNKLSDFSDEDKEWFMKNLPDGTYNSADDVIKTLGWSTQPAGMGMEEDARMRA